MCFLAIPEFFPFLYLPLGIGRVPSHALGSERGSAGDPAWAGGEGKPASRYAEPQGLLPLLMAGGPWSGERSRLSLSMFM